MCNTYFLTRGDLPPAGNIVWQEFKFTTQILSNPNIVWQFVIPIFAKQHWWTPAGSVDRRWFLPNNILRTCGR